MLEKILANADLDVVKGLATPREKQVMTSAKLARAKSMLINNHSQSEIAAALGVSVSTLDSSLNPPKPKD
jgi:DNA-binding CsgD family transcriptional regulator